MRYKLGIGFLCVMAGACLLIGRTGAVGSQAAASGDSISRRVKVLFLGDNGHHVPLERCRDAYSVLGKRGIDLTYTDDLNDLNPATLNRYDVLLLYANWTKISPEQEKALLDYVESGHGFAPIHCASYCFLNSPKITALIGARFKSHSTGVFKETIADGDHPIEKGLKPIESWDETYVHEMHNEKDRHVLSYRIDGAHQEPYTWVRTQGKGRVFYTAWGHDQRTWTNADFQELLERGIRWAAGDWALKEQPKLKPFSYVQATIPNYIQGAAWGTTGKPISQMQVPVSPDESMQHMVVPPGFDVKLFCSEPQVKKPICMAFDERGRLWVAETFDYPNNKQPPGGGHDQITICEDTKGNGIADKFTVFADKLSIPTSMLFANGGVIVAQTPDLLFLKDTTGSGHADLRKVLIHGFGTQDTHATVSNLHWGFDNWIYGTVGYSGFDGEVGGQHVRFGEGVFRLKSDGSKLEFLGSTSNNTWGLGVSEDGQVFGSTANGDPSWYLSIPNRYYEQVRGWPVTRVQSIADSWHFWAITDKVRQVDFFGGYTAGAGHDLYTARSFPKSYWNRVAFVAEPTGHILGQFVLHPQGSSYTATNDFNLLASDDEWTAPIVATVGPDGAVWMIDWYNFIVQHNPIPPGFKKGKGNAYETPLRDKRHGRVYRIIWRDGKPSKTFDLHDAAPDKLIEALHSDNLLWRLHAQRLLVERADKSIVSRLIKLIEDPSVDELGLNPAAIHAIWTMHGLGVLDGSNPDANAAVTKALHHPSAAVRKAALDVLPRAEMTTREILAAKSLDDPDAQVRKNALLALAEMPQSQEAGAAVYSIVTRQDRGDDKSITDAAAIAACRHDAGFLAAAFSAHPVNGSHSTARIESVNLIPNPSFEQAQSDPPRPKFWRVRDYSGKATHTLDTPGHTGQYSLKIESADGSDASMFVDVPVDPGTDYRLSGWIKTKDLARDGGLGALLNVHLINVKTPAVFGTGDWQKVEVAFNTGSQTRVSINCLFGGFGHARGTAWFDDVQLERLQPVALPGVQGRVVSVVVNQYARRAPVDSVVATLSSLRTADPMLSSLVISGLAAGWPQGVAPKLSESDAKELHEVMRTLPIDARDRLLALAERWGMRDLFASDLATIMDGLRQELTDASQPDFRRVDAARRLIAVDDSAQTGRVILKQISPKAAPDVQVGLLDALAESRDATVGKELVAQWVQLAPSAQHEALNLMLRHVQWTPALLDGLQSGKLDNRDLLQQQWQALENNPDPAIADRAAALHKSTGHVPTADRKQILEKFMHVADMPGDAARGKAVFEHNCMVCHTLEGQGGKVGPELTGVGLKPKTELLHKVLDPNSSVEGTYRQWIAKAKDEVISGRIFAENRTSIELIDATGLRHVIQREDLQVLKATDRTMMPEGFEQLGEQSLADLLTYLSQSKVKR